MIEPINLEQLSLHHGKIAVLEGFNKFEHITYRLIEDITKKVNELVDGQNNTGTLMTIAHPAQSFLEPGDSVLFVSPGYELGAEDSSVYDLVVLPDLYPFMDVHQHTITEAVARASKRVIFGFYKVPDQDVVRLERFLNSQGWYWTNDEALNPTYIIDKTES